MIDQNKWESEIVEDILEDLMQQAVRSHVASACHKTATATRVTGLFPKMGQVKSVCTSTR